MVRFPGDKRSCAVAPGAILLLAAGCGTGHGDAAGVVQSSSKALRASPSATDYGKRAGLLTGVACLSASMCVAVGWYYEAKIAGLLGCGVATVKSQASRWLKRLRDLAGVSPSSHGGSPAKVQECHE